MTRDEAWKILLKQDDGEEVSAEDLALALDTFYDRGHRVGDYNILQVNRKQGESDATIAKNLMAW